jgi:death on curing protein
MAAALWHSLIANHPFVDGNRRVGAMAAELFLVVNRVRLIASDQDVVSTTLAVARGEISAEAVWIRQRTLDRG